MLRSIVAGAAALLLGASVAHAAATPEKCESVLLKVAGKYTQCRLNADAKAASSGATADYTNCDAKLQGAVNPATLQRKCPTPLNFGFPSVLKGLLTGASNNVTGLIEGQRSLVHGHPWMSLPYVSMNGVNLSGVNLTPADLTGANLLTANLSRADLSSSALNDANLTGADLSGASASGSYLNYTNLTGANLSGADLGSAELKGANLDGADLNGVDVSGADLRGADLHSADLTEAYMSGADLSGANLTGAYLVAADLTGANLSTVLWNATHCPDGTWSQTNGSSPESCCANLNGKVPAACSP